MHPPKLFFGRGLQFKVFRFDFGTENTYHGFLWDWCSRYPNFYLILIGQHVGKEFFLVRILNFDFNYLFTFSNPCGVAGENKNGVRNLILPASFLSLMDLILSFSKVFYDLPTPEHVFELLFNMSNDSNKQVDEEISFKMTDTPDSENSADMSVLSSCGSTDGNATVVDNSNQTFDDDGEDFEIPELSKESIAKLMDFRHMAKQTREKTIAPEEAQKWEFSTEKVSSLKSLNKSKMFKVVLENIGIPKDKVGLRPMKDTIYELMTDVDQLALPVEIIANHDLVNEDKNPRQVNGVQFEDGLNHKFTLKIYTYVPINAELLYGCTKDWEIGEGHNRWHVMLPGYKREAVLYARAYCPDYNLPNSEILKAIRKSGFMVLGEVQYEGANQKNMPGFVKSGSVKNFRFFYPAGYMPNDDGNYDDIVVEVYSKYFKQVIKLTFNVYDKSKPAPRKCIACNQDAKICSAVKDNDVCIYRQISIKAFKEKLQKLGDNTDYITPVIRQEVIQAQTTEKEQEFLDYYFKGIQLKNEKSSSRKERIRCILAYEGDKLIEAEKEKIRQRELNQEFTEVKSKKRFENSGAVPKMKDQKITKAFIPTTSFHAICSRKNLVGLTKENVLEGLIKAPIENFNDSYSKCFHTKFDVPKMVMVLKKLGAWNEKLQEIGENGSINRQKNDFSEEIEKVVKTVCSKNQLE